MDRRKYVRIAVAQNVWNMAQISDNKNCQSNAVSQNKKTKQIFKEKKKKEP